MASVPKTIWNGRDLLDSKNWSKSPFVSGPALPQPDFTALRRSGKPMPIVGPMDTWGTRMVKSGAFDEKDDWGKPKEEEYEELYPPAPPKGNMFIVNGLPKPYKHGRTPREMFEDLYDECGNPKPIFPDYFEAGKAVRLVADASAVGVLAWTRWRNHGEDLNSGATDAEPEDVSTEPLDSFLRRYHVIGWVRMTNGEVHRVPREECEAAELSEQEVAECNEFINGNIEFNDDMTNRADYGEDYEVKFAAKAAHEAERERYARSGEEDPVLAKDTAEYEAANPLPPLPPDYFHQFEPSWKPEEHVPDHELPGRKKLDHSKHDGTWTFDKNVDTKANIEGRRPNVQYN